MSAALDPAASRGFVGTGPRRSALVGPGESRVVHADAHAPGPNEVNIRVSRAGVCASELPVWQCGPADQIPVTIGHEPVGVVEAIGAAVGTVSVGDIVTGRVEHAFSEIVTACADDLVVVPSAVTGDAGIGEPLGCVVEAIRRTPIDVGDRTAVVGLGFMGLCLLQVLAASSVSDLVAVDPRPDARAAAMRYGATESYDPAALTRASLEGTFDVVFEASGTQPGLDLATELSRIHGALCILGYHQGIRSVDMQTWNWKALEVINGHVRDQRRLVESTRRGLALVAAGKIDYKGLFTHHYTLDDLDRAYKDLATKPDGFIKAVLVLDATTP